MTPVYDLTGRQIFAGDLLKTYHFTGARRKKYWIYHGVRERDGALEMVPVSELCTLKSNGGKCWIHAIAENGVLNSEIIAGYGPNGMSHEDRPRKKIEKSATGTCQNPDPSLS
jgi:hypothetical protein